MGKFFTNKTCIYLDQFAVINLSDDPKWGELLELLKKGIDNEKIVIPYSSEHLFESSHKDYDKAKSFDDLLFSLSRGVGLEIAPLLIPKHLIYAIRKRPVNRSVYTLPIGKSVFSEVDNYSKFKGLKAMFNKMSEEGSSLVNSIREITREDKNSSTADIEMSIKRTNTIYQQELETRLRKFSRYGFFDRKNIEYSMVTIPFWADQSMDTLISSFNMTKAEAKKGEEILKTKGIKNIIPPLYVQTALETMLAVKHQKETANDHFDILRLSSAIPFADIILADKSKVFDIKKSLLDIDFDVEVFSGSKIDLPRLKDRLISLI